MKKVSRPKHSKKKSYFTALLLSMLAVCCVITISLTLFLSASYLSASINMTLDYNRNLVSQTNYSITQMHENAARLIQMLYNDKDIIGFLNMDEQDPLKAVRAAKVLSTQLLTLPNVDSFYLYNAELNLFYSSKTGVQINDESFENPYIAGLITDESFAASNSVSPVPFSLEDGSSSADMLSYIVFDPTPSKSGLRNAIVINVHPSVMTASIRSINQYQDNSDMNFLILDNEGMVLSSSLTSAKEAPEELYSAVYQHISSRSDSNFLSAGGTVYLKSCTTENEYGWYLVSLTPASIILEDIFVSVLISIGILLVTVLAGAVLCLYFARKLNAPITFIANLVTSGTDIAFPSSLYDTEEFHAIADSFQAVQEQNRQFDRLRRDTAFSIKQNCLHSLVSEGTSSPTEQLVRTLKALDLSFILDNTLFMAVLKIDDYQHFLQTNDSKESWVLRFSIINIAEEILSGTFRCTVSGQDNDKFVAFIEYNREMSYKLFQETLEKVLHEIQDKILEYVHLSLSISYSTPVSGIEHIPGCYQILCDALLLKIKYGHGCIISPQMVDDTENESWQFPIQQTRQLTAQISAGNGEAARQLYLQLSARLFQYDYTEIISGMIHLAYNIYTDVLQHTPALKDPFTQSLRQSLSAVQNAEIAADIDAIMTQYIMELCGQVNHYQAGSSRQGADFIPNRIFQIVENSYADPSLCLSSIAEELGLTPNYVGKIFKNAVSKSVAQYISDYRMDKLAQYMKETSLPTSVILEKVGMEKNNYFYTQFKKHFGMSLGEYRLKILENRTDGG